MQKGLIAVSYENVTFDIHSAFFEGYWAFWDRIMNMYYFCLTGSWADRSPLHEAACQGRLLALKTLLSQVYKYRYTYTHTHGTKIVKIVCVK